MDTNLKEKEPLTNIPAGIFHGTEVFYIGTEAFALHEGIVTTFEDLPSMIKRVFFSAFAKDKKVRHFHESELNITSVEAQFKQWLFCSFGALDSTPDYLNGKLIPDSFNSACKRKNCPGRGRFCCKASSLKDHEVATLQEIISGKSVKQIADTLHLSVPGTRSRINKLRDKLNAGNMAALAANAATIIGMVE